MRLRHIIWISALLLGASAFAGIGAPMLTHAQSTNPPAGTLSVEGTGRVTSVPDTASTSFGVTTQASDAQDAMAQNSQQMAKVIAALKRAGVDAKDIQTQYVSLDLRYDNEGHSVVGYTASNSVSAQVRKLSRVGDVIDAGIAAGANNVSGPSLAPGDKDKLYRDALTSAIADARAKAAVLARAAGASVGAVQSITESPQVSYPVMYDAAARTAAASTPIEAGTVDTTATVRVVFTLQ
jgi:uncharacterized protein